MTSVTAATIASYQPSTAPVSVSRRPSECVTIGGGERAREGAPQLGLAVGLDGVDQPVDLGGDDLGEALAHRLQAKRARERRAVALVLVAVEREHARADDAPGREARVVDRERGRVAHDLQREVAAQDEPAAERRQPHHAARVRAGGRAAHERPGAARASTVTAISSSSEAA